MSEPLVLPDGFLIDSLDMAYPPMQYTLEWLGGLASARQAVFASAEVHWDVHRALEAGMVPGEPGRREKAYQHSQGRPLGAWMPGLYDGPCEASVGIEVNHTFNCHVCSGICNMLG